MIVVSLRKGFGVVGRENGFNIMSGDVGWCVCQLDYGLGFVLIIIVLGVCYTSGLRQIFYKFRFYEIFFLFGRGYFIFFILLRSKSRFRGINFVFFFKVRGGRGRICFEFFCRVFRTVILVSVFFGLFRRFLFRYLLTLFFKFF